MSRPDYNWAVFLNDFNVRIPLTGQLSLTLDRKHTMKIINLFLVISFLFISFAYGDSANYIEPLSKIPSRGICLTSPDEKDWFIFDPDGKGGYLAKAGPSKKESYAISVEYSPVRSPGFKSKKEFLEWAKKYHNMDSERFKIRSTNVELDSSHSSYFVNHYILAEDHGANKMPKNQKYAMVEAMGFFACHPDNPNLVIKVGYSYRYYQGHEDPDFKKKAKWVLDQVTFTKL